MRSARLAHLGLLLLASLIAGCSGSPTAEADAKEPTARAGAAGRARGLQVAGWVIDNRAPLAAHPDGSGGGLNALFEPFLTRPVPFPPSVIEAWRRDGLRVVSVPREELEGLRAQLRLTGPLQQQYFGELFRWTVLHTGAESDFPMVIEQEGGTLRLNAGELRLLARAFVIPGDVGENGATRGAMRLDLAVQHIDPSQHVRDSIDLTSARRVSTEDEGPILRTLSASAVTTGADALVIYSDEPAPTGEAPVDTAGPLPPIYPRVGEALLTDYSRLPNPSVRTLLVLEPLVPATYELPGF